MSSFLTLGDQDTIATRGDGGKFQLTLSTELVIKTLAGWYGN